MLMQCIWKRRHTCDYCAKDFSQKNSLYKHVKSVHTSELAPYVHDEYVQIEKTNCDDGDHIIKDDHDQDEASIDIMMDYSSSHIVPPCFIKEEDDFSWEISIYSILLNKRIGRLFLQSLLEEAFIWQWWSLGRGAYFFEYKILFKILLKFYNWFVKC